MNAPKVYTVRCFVCGVKRELGSRKERNALSKEWAGGGDIHICPECRTKGWSQPEPRVD